MSSNQSLKILPHNNLNPCSGESLNPPPAKADPRSTIPNAINTHIKLMIISIGKTSIRLDRMATSITLSIAR
jgi:hypothetical protein